MRALIVDPRGCRAALAAVRGLAGAGWSVGVAAAADAPAARSRHCAALHDVARSEEDLERFLADVRALVLAERYEVVFGCSDRDVLALSEGRSQLGGATLGYPPHDRVRAALDKIELQRTAEAVGMATVRSWPAAEAPAEDRPLVVKERVHGSHPLLGGGDRVETARVDTHRELRAMVAEIEAAGNEALVQAPVNGGLSALAVVADREGRLVARVQQEAEAVFPPGAGASVRATTVAVDERLAGAVEGLLRSLSWTGLAQLQFIVAPGDAPRLIDLNPRFYGSLSLAVASGPNLPAIWAAVATGRPVLDGPRDGRPGVRYHCLQEDVWRVRAESGVGRVAALAECLRYAVGATHAHARLDDPRPGLDVARGMLPGARR